MQLSKFEAAYTTAIPIAAVLIVMTLFVKWDLNTSWVTSFKTALICTFFALFIYVMFVLITGKDITNMMIK